MTEIERELYGAIAVDLLDELNVPGDSVPPQMEPIWTKLSIESRLAVLLTVQWETLVRDDTSEHAWSF